MSLVITALAVYLTVVSANIQHPRDLACAGHLGAGFPATFLCDDDAGSPISSWGKIDDADWSAINPFTFLLDTLCYAVPLSLPWLLVGHSLRLVHQRHASP